METRSDDFTTWNGDLLRGRTAHLSLRSSNTRGRSNMLSFWCHRNREIGVEDDENEKSFKFFLTLDKKLSKEEEESNDDSWNTVVFYRHTDRRDTWRMSRSLILARLMACILNATWILRVKGRMSPQLLQTRGNAPKMQDSRLIKIASLQRSHLFSKTRVASSQ